MIMPQTKLTREQIENIVGLVKFKDRTFRVLEKGDGFLLQMQYYEADVEKSNSKPMLQSTRKYYISPFMTVSEVVETCWLCVTRSQMHVASEHFIFKGRRIYSQHFHVDARVEACDANWFDKRES